MATTKTGLINQDPYASPSNLGGQKTQAQAPSNSPYRGGLTTDFSGLKDPNFVDDGGQVHEDEMRLGNKKYMSNLQANTGSVDPDVVQANYQAWQLQNHPGGMDTAESQSLYDMYSGRIGEKNSLAEQIAGGGDQLNQAQDTNKATAGAALGQGLKNTRQNYNSRGLLYSGMRQGGEQSVKNSVASQLASSMTGTARDSANSMQAAKNAYASVDLASRQDTLNRANQAFDTASANNIARLQAMQQLGGGLGAATGYVAGSNYSPGGPSYQNPAAGWNPGVTTDGSMPQLGSQYGGTPQYGLIGGTQNQDAVGGQR